MPGQAGTKKGRADARGAEDVAGPGTLIPGEQVTLLELGLQFPYCELSL